VITSLTALAVVCLLMLVELRVSRTNEQQLKARGAVEPPDPVYGTMRWAYPGVFVAMAIEGALWGDAPRSLVLAGAVMLGLAKLLKYWAILSLGDRWTYRVFVLPNAPLVTSGPYRWLRHPNYVAVLGELLAMALVTRARVMGPVGLLFFGALLVLRIRAEERALGLQRSG
jgi:methyltransferase